MDSMETKKKLTTILIHVILIIVSITMLVPFIWMILTAFKTVTEATSVDPFTIFPKIWRKDAFISVINNMNFLLLYKNTLLLIFFRVVCAVLTATMAGYAFGRLNFKGRDLCFSLVLFQMMVPVQIFIIPQYLMVSKMGMQIPGTDGCISDRLHSDDRDLHDLPETVYRRYCYQRWKTVIRNIT